MREYLKQIQREAEEKEAKRRHTMELIGTGLAILLIYVEVALAIL